MNDALANTAAMPVGSAHCARQAMRRTDPFMDEVIALLPMLRSFGCSLCGDPARADDLVHDTVIKAHIHRAQFRASSNLKAWLFTILRNCYFSELRHQKFELEDAEDMHATRLSMDVDYIAGIQVLELDRAMRELPRQQREALVLVHVAGLPYATVAHDCGVAIGTIKSRIARARASLNTWLGDPLSS